MPGFPIVLRVINGLGFVFLTHVDNAHDNGFIHPTIVLIVIPASPFHSRNLTLTRRGSWFGPGFFERGPFSRTSGSMRKGWAGHF